MANSSQLSVKAEVYPVDSIYLASGLIALDVPLRHELVGGKWEAVTNVYSDRHPGRKNGRRILGKTTFYFEGRTRDGRTKTKDLIQAWDDVAKLSGEAPQAVVELDKLRDELLTVDMTEEKRHEIRARWEFWEAIAWVQGFRVALGHAGNLTKMMTDNRIPPLAQWQRANGSRRFQTVNPSSL